MDLRLFLGGYFETAQGIFLGAMLQLAAHCDNQFNKHWNAANKTKTAKGAHALVVFAGGYGRIRAAFEDAKNGQAVVISGGHPKSNLRQTFGVLRLNISDVSVQEPNIHLLSNALNTRGNALETAHWLHANPHIKSIVVYTSANHVPRAHFELQGVLPDNITVRFHPVENGNRSWGGIIERAKIGCKTNLICNLLTYTKPLREPYDLKVRVDPLELTANQ